MIETIKSNTIFSTDNFPPSVHTSTQLNSITEQQKLTGKNILPEKVKLMDEATTHTKLNHVSKQSNSDKSSSLKLTPLNQLPMTKQAKLSKLLQLWIDEVDDPSHKQSRIKVKDYLLLKNAELLDNGKIFVQDNIDFSSQLNNIVELPDHLYVEGSLILFGCKNLLKIQNLEVTKSLNCGGCSKLGLVTGTVKIGGVCNFGGCENLIELAGNFKAGTLILNSCTRLNFLTQNLYIEKSLSLYNCTSLTSMPNKVKGVGGDIVLDKCRSLTLLPNWLINLGLTTEGRSRQISVRDTGLSQHLLHELNEPQDSTDVRNQNQPMIFIS